MKRIVFALLFAACSSEDVGRTVDGPAPPPAPSERRPAPKLEGEPLVCEIARVDQASGCTIYTYACEDGQTLYGLTCTTRPIGTITNPPRPIDEQEAAFHP